jgi:threonine dehydrogenase-like Zn-dependent dehydrogenase
VAVIGCGAIGLLCLLAALTGGAVSVDDTSLSLRRLTAAGHLGAASAAELDGDYEVVIDAVWVGRSPRRAGAAAASRRGGRLARPGRY